LYPLPRPSKSRVSIVGTVCGRPRGRGSNRGRAKNVHFSIPSRPAMRTARPYLH
jgi:hypothetical protein